jgi:hypothetical protein
MRKLSVISHFYNNHEAVDRQLAHWEKIDHSLVDMVEFILVDDHSDKPYKKPETHLNLRLFRVLDDIKWNQSGSRNLGAFHAVGQAGLLIDIDQLIYIDFLQSLCLSVDRLPKNTINFFKILNGIVDVQNGNVLIHHPNSYVVNMEDYRRNGFYDEDFAGYYGYEDVFMFEVWKNRGGKLNLIDQVASEQMDFGTKNLDRDVSRNKALIYEKIRAENLSKSRAILRFQWEEVL